MSERAEEIWTMVHKFIECENDQPKLYGRRVQKDLVEGSDLSEMKSHRILELMGETMTVLQLRKHLKDLDLDNNKKMCISEYILDKYKITPDQLVHSPQGSVDPVKLAEAQAAFENAATLLANASDAKAAASKAFDESKEAATQAQDAKEKAEKELAEAEAAEAKVKVAEAELQASIDEIEILEKTKSDKITKYQAIIDGDGGAVKKGRAVQEKEALLSEDELPLRKAKITQKAALKKVTKARVAAEKQRAESEAASEAAAAAKTAADEAEVAAAAAKTTSEEAEVQAQAALDEATQKLDELKSEGGSSSPQGALWWMERELAEKKKFMR